MEGSDGHVGSCMSRVSDHKCVWKKFVWVCLWGGGGGGGGEGFGLPHVCCDNNLNTVCVSAWSNRQQRGDMEMVREAIPFPLYKRTFSSTPRMKNVTSMPHTSKDYQA